MYSSRTYGKRAVKRKSTSDLDEFEPQADRKTKGLQKRRKVDPLAPENTGFPSTDVEGLPARILNVTKTYGSPRKSNARPASSSPSPNTAIAVDSPPSLPLKFAKDLSTIFAAATPSASPSASPTKLAKRMLARSKTESSIESGHNGHDKRTPSLPNISSSPLKLADVASSSRDTLSVFPLLAPAPKSGTTRTYAGKSRSFLIPVSTAIQPVDGRLEENIEDEYSRESYLSLRARWGMDQSEDDPYAYDSPSPSRKGKSAATTPNVSPSKCGRGKAKSIRAPPLPHGMMNPLKSITELRNKGETRRFLDEAGYLFEGMDKDQGPSLRRASAVELTAKLCDAEFARNTKAADFYGRIWELLIEAGAGKGEDKILDTCLVFFASLVTRDPISLAELAQHKPLPSSPILLVDELNQRAREKQRQEGNEGDLPFIDTLFFLLGKYCDGDPDALVLVAPNNAYGDVELRRVGVSKKEKTTLSTVYNTIATKSTLFPPQTQISIPLLITHILQSLSPSIIPPKHFYTLLISLRSSLTRASSLSTPLASVLQQKWHTTVELPFTSIHYHLRLLDLYLLGQWGSSLSSEQSQSQPRAVGLEAEEDNRQKEINNDYLTRAREEWLTDELVALGVCAEIKINKKDDHSSVTKCMEFVLRVLVSLTHGDESWGRKIMENDSALGWLMRIISRAGDMVSAPKTLSHATSTLSAKKVKVKAEKDEKGGDPTDLEEEYVNDTGENSRGDIQALDRLCLALALLTNLVQAVEEVKNVLRETRLDPYCSLKKRSCLRECSCPNSTNALDVLVQLYTQLLPQPSPAKVKYEEPESTLDNNDDDENAEADADASFLRGHLAVLFGLLMRGSVVSQQLILSILPDPSLSPHSTPGTKGQAKETGRLKTYSMTASVQRAKLSRLVEQARAFVVFFAYVNQKHGLGENEDEGRESERDGKCSDRVAKEIVTFLETLRDGAV